MKLFMHMNYNSRQSMENWKMAIIQVGSDRAKINNSIKLGNSKLSGQMPGQTEWEFK